MNKAFDVCTQADAIKAYAEKLIEEAFPGYEHKEAAVIVIGKDGEPKTVKLKLRYWRLTSNDPGVLDSIAGWRSGIAVKWHEEALRYSTPEIMERRVTLAAEALVRHIKERDEKTNQEI